MTKPAANQSTMGGFSVIKAHLSRQLARTHDARTLYAVDDKGGARNSAIIRKMSANKLRGMATSAIWKAT